MPKGEKLRAKQIDHPTTCEFWKIVLEFVFFFKILLQQNLVSYGGEFWLWEKGGVFGTWSILLLEYLSICPNKCVWLRDRKKNVICKNKPSGGKKWSKYAKSQVRKFGLQICTFENDVALLVAF
jgi:hypothetical protein